MCLSFRITSHTRKNRPSNPVFKEESLQDCQLSDGLKISHLNSEDIDTCGKIPGVETDLVDTCRIPRISQKHRFRADKIKHGKPDPAVILHPETNFGFRIEGIRIILVEKKVFGFFVV